jgi:STE24 endopeptidase
MDENSPNNTRAPASAEETKRYARIKLAVGLADGLLSLTCLALFAFSGLAARLAGLAARLVSGDILQFLVFVAIAGASFSLLGTPLSFYSGYVLEHRFGLSTLSVAGWLRDRLKSALLSIAIGVPVALLFYSLLKTAGASWWMYFGACVFVLGIVFARLAPLVIFPLFYTFTPLGPGPVREALEGLLAREGVSISGIFVFDMSRETRKANAGFTGLGRGRRIILGDTLLREFTPDEIRVIFAHELGHLSGRHIPKNIVLSGALIFLSLGTCSAAYNAAIRAMGLSSPHDLAAIPILMFLLSVLSLALMPFTNAVSRAFERAADRHALELTGDPSSFISAMEKISVQNLAERDPHPAVEFLFHGHPSIGKRIAFARARGGIQEGFPEK